MNKQNKYELLRDLIARLTEFKHQSSVEIDPLKTFIISDDELRAIDTALSAVIDCLEIGDISKIGLSNNLDETQPN